jgi:hypothetical protein
MPDLPGVTSKSEVSESKFSMKLSVISSGTTDSNTELEITPLGLKGSLRGAGDGAVYFGCKKRGTHVEGGKGEILNDYLLPVEDPEMKNQHRGRHFVIYYDQEKLCYFLRDLVAGFGVFAKVEYPIVRPRQLIKENYMLSIGESFCIFNISGPSSSSVLHVKAFTNSTSGSSL